ncbi:MAG TPA: Ig-like domain-containing protein, partial [Longimicrobiales bacterium]|nr:Ig-like domain-containing protein [Longimicrobiales bacterium]
MTSANQPRRADTTSRRATPLITVLLSILAASCDGGTVTEVEVTSVSVSPASVNLEVTDTVRLTATSRGAGGGTVPGVAVTWSTDDSSIASVTQSGLVTGAGEGTTTVRASAAGVQGAASVTVNRRTVASVAVEPSSVTLVSGDTAVLTAFARAANGDALTGRPASWASSDTSVVQVDTTGSIVGGAPGTATVSATVEGVVGSASVEVAAPQGIKVGSAYDFACALVRREV